MTKSLLISDILPNEARALIPEDIEVEYRDSETPLSKEDLIRRLAGKDGLVCQIITEVDDEVLAACPALKVVANVGVGYDNIDIEAAKKRGVVVTNTPDVLTETTADFAWALLMAAARRVAEADRYVRDGRWTGWKWDLLRGQDVHGRTLGVVGLGRIGSAVARRAHGFDMRILYHDAKRAKPEVERDAGAQFAPLDRVLAEADFLTVHTPLSPETRHLIGEAALKKMKRTAVLVNTSRGPVVDEAALARALVEGSIAAAGLDVFEDEPKVHPDLLPLRNVVLAPHIASSSSETRLAMATLAVRNCLAVLEGKGPLTPVTRPARPEPSAAHP